MKTPINNNIDQLFNKAKADDQNLDDFEKEAMAGFDMLASKEEANELKADLDKRINKELFYKKESHNPKVYWLAAAGLALIIGLSTLFILNDTSTISNNNLAITDTKTENAPNIGGELKEEITSAAETIVSDQKAPVKEVAEKLISEEKKGLVNDETKEIKTEKEATKRMVAASTTKEQRNDGDFEQQKAGGKKENNQSGEGAYGGVSQTIVADDLAKTSSLKDKETDNLQTKGIVAKPVQTSKLAELEASAKNEVVTGNTKSKDSNREDDSKNKLDKVEIASNASPDFKTDRKENRAKESAKKSKSKEPKSSNAGPVTIDYKPGAPATKAAEESEIIAVPAEDKRDESAFINCYYPGGESAITKDLKEKLIKENLNQKFDVTLYVNEKKIVEKVEFINSYDLTKKQKEEVTKILKDINKFNFFMVPTKKSTFPYKVLYRP